MIKRKAVVDKDVKKSKDYISLTRPKVPTFTNG